MRWISNKLFTNFQRISTQNYVDLCAEKMKNQRVSAYVSAIQRIQLIFYIILAHSAHFLQNNALKLRWHLDPGTVAF